MRQTQSRSPRLSSRNGRARKTVNLYDPSLYFNRELSALDFQEEVLEEALDCSHPLLERLKFLCIVASNLDEFFMIRVAALKEQIAAGIVEPTPDNISPQEQLRRIRERLLDLYARHERVLLEDVLPALAREGIRIIPYADLNEQQQAHFRRYFARDVFPILTPLILDPGHPFPRLLNRSINIAFHLAPADGRGEHAVGVLQLPPLLPRLLPIPQEESFSFVLLEEVVQSNAEELYKGWQILNSYCFRVTRDAELEIAEDEAEDLLREIAEQTRVRNWGADAVRLEVDAAMPPAMRNLIMQSLGLEPSDVYEHRRPMNLSDFLVLLKLDLRHLKDQPFTTRIPPEFVGEGEHLFEMIRQRDVFVHHPFDSFSNTVVKLVRFAATDPTVVAIKIILYRAGGDSPVIEALKAAAMNGKSVTAVVELKARFDEENNIIWARELERAGVHVVYGVLGLKVHAKALMIVRREVEGMRTYVHLATGNYNHATARVYTDFGYFTAREDIGRDVANLFNLLTANARHVETERLILAPQHLVHAVVALIEETTQAAVEGQQCRISAKLNALVDPDVIRALYRASMAGVQVRLLVRGICCLRPGVTGVSSNIEVRSIVGRFLEHSRLLIVEQGEQRRVFISSADWMPRNFYRRVETLLEVPDEHIADQLQEIFETYWRDNVKARVLQPDGRRLKRQPTLGEAPFNAQNYFLERIRRTGG
ncbi:MAG: polyphosphate kinase 1 [Bacteroidota bacterium]|nr:polyphosphate kinase 1 [Candidatus Kapabacteria bacterium]MCS7301986.1 polyphosphate kinase 1 [Candidatus Kapabacteria bacterium]MCX7936558.1 polyphosphate kinase 1 [Chlorobiota bacterium]MDW8074751.1 polyphosphate kinase 1 [Bacteroidota bacterium]MDW8271390.1 polyphosphate kinase 1 [Bacteroidota bacterium]